MLSPLEACCQLQCHNVVKFLCMTSSDRFDQSFLSIPQFFPLLCNIFPLWINLSFDVWCNEFCIFKRLHCWESHWKTKRSTYFLQTNSHRLSKLVHDLKRWNGNLYRIKNKINWFSVSSMFYVCTREPRMEPFCVAKSNDGMRQTHIEKCIEKRWTCRYDGTDRWWNHVLLLQSHSIRRRREDWFNFISNWWWLRTTKREERKLDYDIFTLSKLSNNKLI